MDGNRLMARTFLGNAVFSLLCAGVALLGGAWLAGSTGIPLTVLRVLGLGLLPFVALTAYLGTRREPPVALAALVTAGDAAWVLGSAAVLALVPLHAPGHELVAVVALGVAVCATLQAVGLKRRGAGGRRARS